MKFYHCNAMKREHKIYRVTIAGGVVNVLLLAFKFVAGILSHSSAMVADAVHSLSDFLTDIIVLIFVHISGKPKDESHDYGHGKYETLASTAIGIALLIVAGGIIGSGVDKIISCLHGEPVQVPGMLALWAAILSIILKEFIFRYTDYWGIKLNSDALRANALHHRSDALSSIGTAMGIGLAIFLGDKWVMFDPLASVIVGLFIIRLSVSLLKRGIDELMERSLPADIENEILSIASAFPDVIEPHDLRTRRIGPYSAIELHILMDGNIPLRAAHDRASDIEDALRAKYGKNTHVAIHVEPIGTNDTVQ